MEIIKFGRHKPPTVGHVTVRVRSGWPSRLRQRRIIVTFTDGKWLDKDGNDYTEAIEYIERIKLIKKLEKSCNNTE